MDAKKTVLDYQTQIMELQKALEECKPNTLERETKLDELISVVRKYKEFLKRV